MDMTEETDATETGGAEESANVEETSEATTEQDTGTEETGQADDAGEETEEPPKRVPWFQKRIDEVTRQKYDAQREADYWRGLAEGRIQPTQQQPQQQVGPPQLDQFDDYDSYEQAKISYHARQEAEALLHQMAQQHQRHQLLSTYEQRENAARQSFPDYDNVVKDPTLPITPLMAEVIRESDVGPGVAYHLGTNRQEAQRIAALPLHRQAAELGRIEASLSQAPPAQQRTAPNPPPKTVAGISAGINKNPADMSMAEYAKWMQTRDQ